MTISGHLLVRWPDGSPAAGASIMSFFTEAAVEAEGSKAHFESVFGTTDQRGMLPFGPLPDIEYEQVLLHATHPAAPFVTREWRAQLIQEGQLFEVVMTPGRTVSGRLVSSEGMPAVGYRVSRLEASMDTVVCTTDSEGRFAAPGLDPAGGSIVVCDPLSAALRHLPFAHMVPRLHLLTVPVAPGLSDVGTVVLPRR